MPGRVLGHLAGALAFTALAGCMHQPAGENVAASDERGNPGIDLAKIRAEVIDLAREQQGAAAVETALNAPSYVIVARYVGMAPPPPPGAGPEWRVPIPTAVLYRDATGWRKAKGGAFHAISTERSAEIDAILSSQEFRNEPAITPACPDYGSSQAIARTSKFRETVRVSQCGGIVGKLESAALAA